MALGVFGEFCCENWKGYILQSPCNELYYSVNLIESLWAGEIV